jgi:hypothetical protein
MRASISRATGSLPSRHGEPWFSASLDRRGLALLSYALAVAGGAALIVGVAQPPTSFPAWSLVLAAWLTAVFAYLGVWLAPPVLFARAAQMWRNQRRETVAALCIVLIALLLRAVALDDFPRTLGGDDGAAALRAREVLQGEIGSPFGAASISGGRYPTLYFFGMAGVMRVFGDDVIGARMFSALVGTGAVAALYLLGRQWFSAGVGLVAAAILAGLPYHLFWSRNPLNNVGDTLAVILILLFATRAFATGRPSAYALAGVSLGLGQYGYQSARLMFGVVAMLVLREWLLDPRWLKRNWSNLLILIGGLGVSYFPQLAYYLGHPDDLFGRYTGVSIFHSGWLEREIERTGRPAVEIIAELIRRAFLVFTHESPRVHFDPGRPLFDPLSSLLFGFGVLYSALNIRRRPHAVLLFTLAAFLVGLALTENAPNSARAVATGPLGVMLVALGLVQIGRVSAPLLRQGSVILVATTTAFIFAYGAHFFFFQYAATYDRGAAPITELGYYMRQFPGGTRFIFVALPRLSCTTHPSLKYLAPSWVCLDAPGPGGDRPWPEIRPGDVVVALPERQTEAESVLAARGYAAPDRRWIGQEAGGKPLLLAYHLTE